MRTGNIRRSYKFDIFRICFYCMTLVIGYDIGYSQTKSIYDGNVPSSVPGSPLGSYSLSNFEDINLFNGTINFKVPLVGLAGRGNSNYSSVLTIQNNNKWAIEQTLHSYDRKTENVIQKGIETDPFGPGYVEWKRIVTPQTSNENPCINGNPEQQMLTTFIYHAPDGTAHVLFDKATQGKALIKACSSTSPSINRGRIFISADRALTFITDYDVVDGDGSIPNVAWNSGRLLFKDGSLLGLEKDETGKAYQYIRDKNGNKTTFKYYSIQEGDYITGYQQVITDSLNRTVTYTYKYTDVFGIVTYKGFDGSQRTIKLYSKPMNEVLVPGETLKKNKDLFPSVAFSDTDESKDRIVNNHVVSSIEYPNGQILQFFYNSYGEVARVILPTGGGYDYEYSDVQRYGFILQRRLQKRTIYKSLTPETAYYTPPNSLIASKSYFNTSFNYISPVRTIITIENKDSNDALLSKESHEFYGYPGAYGEGGCVAGWPIWYDGREYKSERFIILNGSVVGVGERIEHTYSSEIKPHEYGTCSLPQNNPQVTMTTKTLPDVGLQSAQKYAYDGYGNRTNIWEYDYGNGAPGILLRHTQTEYLTYNYHYNVNYAEDLNIHIRNLPTVISVYSGIGELMSRTNFEYDRYDMQPLQDAHRISQHDNSYNTAFYYRGNLVKMFSTIVSTEYKYDIAGNIVRATNTLGNVTSFDYSDRFGLADGETRSNIAPGELSSQNSYAFPTKVTNSLGHESYIQYDYYIGRPVNMEDANGVISSIYYNDSLDRPTQIINAINNISSKKQITNIYSDVSRKITVTSDLTSFGDNKIKSESIYDGLGRKIESRIYENTTDYIRSFTEYNSFGLPYRSSNPHRLGETETWIITSYDSLGRIVDVKTPDSASVITQYSGKQVTVTDQAGNKRRSETDALGRLVKITEDPSGLNYDTSYSYDALGNLLQVNQGTQQGIQNRTFTYDSLSRLISATNPENRTVTYSYDANGNLIEKVDARAVKTTMTYDALNRVKSKVYSGTTPEGAAIANATPPVYYFYDDYSTLPSGAPALTGSFTKGRLVGITYGIGNEGSYYKYDALGRVETNHQRLSGRDYPTSYFYNLSGNITREQRKGRDTSMFYDEVGRLKSIDTSISPYNLTYKLVSNIEYTSFGALKSESYYNGLVHNLDYNSRQQPIKNRLGKPDDLESIFKLDYFYGTSNEPDSDDNSIITTQNNGNIARINYKISGNLQHSQTFRYDPLNRLKYTVEHNNGNHTDAARSWYQTFDYDRFGNRGVNVANTSDNVDASNSALQLPDFSVANNRITRSGFTYDASGNLISESGKNYTYDAENRIITTVVSGGATSQYFYDGNGRRVKKDVGGVKTGFEYGAGGELLSEINEANGSVKKGYIYRGGELLATKELFGNYKFATSDHLGSPRVWTDWNGNLISRHDYLPFGEELFAGMGTRTTAQGYATNTQQDGQRKQFTSKERDSETGLDYFLARYYSSAHGRFTSPDPLLSSGNIVNPQSWNRYTYSSNNPVKYNDPTGLYIWDASYGGNVTDAELRQRAGKDKEELKKANEIIRKRNEFRNSLAEANRALEEMVGAERNSAEASLGAYGAEGTDNGVTVGSGDLADGVAAQATVTGYTYLESSNSMRANISVKLSNRGGSDRLSIDVAHEGRHARDAQNYAVALTADIANGGTNAVNGAFNMTRYEREVRAYIVSSAVAQGLRLDNMNVSGQRIWDTGWREADRATLRAQAIDNILKDSPNYKLTPQNPGERFQRREQ